MPLKMLSFGLCDHGSYGYCYWSVYRISWTWQQNDRIKSLSLYKHDPQKGLKGGEEGFVIVKKIRHLK
jgi:hypothetical protein